MLSRSNFIREEYFSACEATPRSKLRFKADNLEPCVLHELFLKLLSLLPEENFGYCKLSYGSPKRSLSFSHQKRTHAEFPDCYKLIQIYSISNFPVSSQIDFWISKDKILLANITAELSEEKNINENLDVTLFMIRKCLLENISQFEEK